jgi:hypothetical protein
MARDTPHTPKSQTATEATPFDSAEEAWFWFIQAQQARADGAQTARGAGLVPRPCEPIDILQTLDRLYRSRSLAMDHLLVLRHYGRRMMRPDPRRAKEIRAYRLWMEAMARLTELFEEKGIIRPNGPFAPWLVGLNIVSLDLYREAAE